MSLLYWISVRASRAGRARVSVPDLAMGRKEGWGLGGMFTSWFSLPKGASNIEYWNIYTGVSYRRKNEIQRPVYVRTEVLVFEWSPPMVQLAGIYGLFKNMNFRNYKKLWSCCRLLQVTRSSFSWLLAPFTTISSAVGEVFSSRNIKIYPTKYNKNGNFSTFPLLPGDMWHVIHSNPGNYSYTLLGIYRHDTRW